MEQSPKRNEPKVIQPNVCEPNQIITADGGHDEMRRPMCLDGGENCRIEEYRTSILPWKRERLYVACARNLLVRLGEIDEQIVPQAYRPTASHTVE